MSRQHSTTFDSLCAERRDLLHKSDDPSWTHREFEMWDHHVTKWLDHSFPNSGVSAEWSSLYTSPLVSAGHYYDDYESWAVFRVSVQKRLAWLGQLGRAIQSPRQTADSKHKKSPIPSKRVFVVHGRNEAIR